jgi:hypothetical protein
MFHTLLAPTGIALVDEAEFGLEPHRIARLLRLLGAGNDAGPQVFLTTHSPIVVRELRAQELAITHYDPASNEHVVSNVSDIETGLETQGFVRRCAEAFLAAQVVVAEGPTEVGLVRGLDHYWVSDGQDPFALRGITVADGGGVPHAAARAAAFAKLGYRTLLLIDDDRPLTPEERTRVEQAGASILSWGNAQATEDALFSGLAWVDVQALLTIAEEIWGATRLNDNLRSYSDGQIDFVMCRAVDQPAHRELLATTAKRQDWFKRIDFGERVAQEVLGPGWPRATPELRATVEQLYLWSRGG